MYTYQVPGTSADTGCASKLNRYKKCTSTYVCTRYTVALVYVVVVDMYTREGESKSMAHGLTLWCLMGCYTS